MPVTLNTTIEPVLPDSAKVVAFKVENNVEHWIEIWVAFGAIVDEHFVEAPTIPPAYFKIEDGVNPFAANVSLRRCPECELWFGLEENCSACGGQTDPYDGFSRLVSTTPTGANMYEAIEVALYSFLLNESVPNPDTGEVEPLLDAE